MTGPDDSLSAVTPEQVEVTLPHAGVASRILAAALDHALLTVGVLALWLPLGLAGLALGEDLAGGLALAALALLSLATTTGYFVLFELGWSGQTPGKRLAGLRVVRLDGGPLDARSACLRNLLRVVDVLPVGYAAGLLAMAASGRRQRLGDLAAGTVVVVDAAVARRPLLAAELMGPAGPGRARALEWLAAADAGRLGRDGAAAVRCYLERRSELAPEVARRRAAELVEALRPRLELPPPPADLEPGEALAALYERRG